MSNDFWALSHGGWLRLTDAAHDAVYGDYIGGFSVDLETFITRVLDIIRADTGITIRPPAIGYTPAETVALTEDCGS